MNIMNKKRPTRKKKTVKVLEKPGSSRDLTPNPYSDDGEYGSDSNYDPEDDNMSSSSTSDFVVRPKRKRKCNESSAGNTPSEADSTDERSDSDTVSVIEDTEDGLSSSSESIFDLRVTNKPKKDIPTNSSECKYQSVLPIAKKSRHNLSGSIATRQPSPNGSIKSRSDADTLSVSSEILKKLEDDFTLENATLSLDHAEIVSYTKHEQQRQYQVASSSFLPSNSQEKEAKMGFSLPIPSSSHLEDIEPNSGSPPLPLLLPEDKKANQGSPPPPHKEEMEANSGSLPPPHPEEIEASSGSPPPPHREGIEGSSGSPPPQYLEETETSSGSQPPPHLEEIEASSGTPSPPHLEEVEANPSSPPQPHPVEMESNPGVSGIYPPQPVTLPLVGSNSNLRDASPSLQIPLSAEANRPLPSSGPENVEGSPIPHASRSRTRDSDLSARRRLRRLQSSPRPETWEASTSDIPVFDFHEDSAGIQFELRRNASALEVFNELLSPNIVDFIVAKTNDYGRKLCNSDRPSTRTAKKYTYKDLNKEELFKFFGLCFLMGQINTPQKRKLFTFTDTLYFHPIFQHVMSARRFEQILRCLCVSELNAKKKDKIVNFINAVTENFRKCYKPNKELSLDESLLLFRGRLSFRQYIKSKKARYGIKFYELASSDGYMLNILMYTGQDDDDPTEHGRKTEKIVMRLMKPFLMKGHWLFMDNYCNSVELSEKLLGLQTHTAGTLRTNRKCNPKELVKRKLKKGEHFWVRKNKVYVSKWLDKRPILMVTTLNQPKLVEVSNRHGQRRMKPEEISIYNKHMAGIDRSDQMISYYSSPRKSLRWYKKVIFHLLDLTVWNSYYLYKKYCRSNNKRCEFLQFREDLIRQLLNLAPGLKPASLMNRNRYDNRQHEPGEYAPPTNTASFGHWPEKNPVRINSKKTSTYMKCKMCAKKKIRRETSLRCMACEDKPALCAVCFQEWHSQ